MAIRIKILLPLIIILLFYREVRAQSTLNQATILPELTNTDNLQRLVDTAIKNYPRIRYFQNRVNVASANVSKIKASWLDALTVSYVYTPNDPTINPVNPTSTYFKGLQAGVFLNVGQLL